MNDWCLLREYLEDGSEPAFEKLVRRHLDMVYSAALRQVHNAHLAEDVTQAVFVLLARKAARLSSGVIVGGWLYRTACLVAQRALRDQIRRQLRESQAADMNQTASIDDLWERLAPQVDTAMAGLGEADRNSIVLRFFEGRSFREVAEALGVSEDAAKKRVMRALEKLREILIRRGVAVTVASVSAGLAANGAQAAPAGLLAASVKAAAGTTAGAGVAALVTATLREASFRRLKWGATSVAVGLLFLAMWTQIRRGPPMETAAKTDDPPPASNVESSRQTAMVEREAASVVSPPAKSLTMALRVVTAESDLPITNAEIRAVFYGPQFIRSDSSTDADGMAYVTRPSRLFAGMAFWVAAHQRVPRVIGWERDEEPSLPHDYTVRLGQGHEVRGLVVDENQRPVPGAKVKLNGEGREWNSREYMSFSHPLTVPVTDAAGVWIADFLPAAATRLAGLVQHPDYADTTFQGVVTGAGTNPVLIIQRGSAVAGFVRDSDGKPVSGANLELQDTSGRRDRRQTQTDDEGLFEFPHVAKGTVRLAAAAEDYLSAERQLSLDGIANTNLEFTMRTGPIAGNSILHGRVVDEEQRPVSGGVGGGTVNLLSKQSGLEGISWRGSVDESGRFEWRHAPNRAVKLSFGGWDWQEREVELLPDGTEHVVMLQPKPAVLVSGTVTDKTSRDPVPRFKVFLGGPPNTQDNPRLLGEGDDGKFVFRTRAGRMFENGPHSADEVRLMFDADGYSSRVLIVSQQTNDLVLNVELEPAGEVLGVVLLADGKPASGAEVSFRGPHLGVTMHRPGEFVSVGQPSQIKARAKADGKFRIRLVPGAERLAVTHASGWGSVPLSTLPDSPIRLEAWGRIEGVILLGGLAWPTIKANARVIDPAPGQLYIDLTAEVDSAGRFEFPKVPSGGLEIVLIEVGEDIGVPIHSQVVSVQAGETTKVTVGK